MASAGLRSHPHRWMLGSRGLPAKLTSPGPPCGPNGQHPHCPQSTAQRGRRHLHLRGERDGAGRQHAFRDGRNRCPKRANRDRFAVGVRRRNPDRRRPTLSDAGRLSLPVHPVRERDLRGELDRRNPPHQGLDRPSGDRWPRPPKPTQLLGLDVDKSWRERIREQGHARGNRRGLLLCAHPFLVDAGPGQWHRRPATGTSGRLRGLSRKLGFTWRTPRRRAPRRPSGARSPRQRCRARAPATPPSGWRRRRGRA